MNYDDDRLEDEKNECQMAKRMESKNPKFNKQTKNIWNSVLGSEQ